MRASESVCVCVKGAIMEVVGEGMRGGKKED